MAGLTQDRNTPFRDGEEFFDPMAANAKIFAGALVALNAAGLAVPGATATTLTARGCAEEFADNTGGADSALSVRTRKGVFRFDNDGSVTRANVGLNAFIVDDHTVAATNGTNTRSLAGVIVDVDTNGVWVRIA